MSLRSQLIVLGLLLVVVSATGAVLSLVQLNRTSLNQEMIGFKHEIFRDQSSAAELMQSAQAKVYEQQAAFTRNIDSMVDEIMEVEGLVARIPDLYRRQYDAPYCQQCHPEGYARIEELGNRFANLQKLIHKYKEDVSILITTTDGSTRFVQHARAKAAGEEVIRFIGKLNDSASTMVRQIELQNSDIVNRSRLIVQSAVATMTIVVAIVVFLTLYLIRRCLSGLLKGTEAITEGDYTLRLTAKTRGDEVGELVHRFNLMAEKIAERERDIRDTNTELARVNDQIKIVNETLETKVAERTMSLENSMKELEALSARLERTNRDLIRANEAKDNFLSVVSHELRTPLMVMQGYYSLLLNEDYRSDPQKATEALQCGLSQCERLGELINELITLSRVDKKSLNLKPESVNFDDIVRKAIERFHPSLERRQLRVIHGDHLHMPPLNCDPAKFQEVLSHLLSNAVKFSPNGGEIEVGCEEREADFLIFCRDQGIGIPPQEREKIFEKFYQVDSTSTRTYEGAGLGLSVVKDIVSLHDGKVWVESEPGQGSTFYFTLPKRTQANVSAHNNYAEL